MPASVIAFDPVRDVAVLAVPALAAPPLPIVDGSVGDVGAVYGHPGGGPLQAVTGARRRRDRRGRAPTSTAPASSRRHVYVLASRLAPGDSGGALVDRDGNVIGMAFAIDPGRNATAYALTDAEVRPVLDRGSTTVPRTAVDTGGCLVA